jgi:hypothetical protein
MAKKGTKVTKAKNCRQTSCGLTCIPTSRTCRINDPKSKAKIAAKTDKLKKAVDAEVEKAFRTGGKTGKRPSAVTRKLGKAALDDELGVGRRPTAVTRALGKAILDEYGRAGDKARKAVDKEVEKGSGTGIKGSRKATASANSKTLRREAAQRVIAELGSGNTKPKKEKNPVIKAIKATEPPKQKALPPAKETLLKTAPARVRKTESKEKLKPAELPSLDSLKALEDKISQLSKSVEKLDKSIEDSDKEIEELEKMIGDIEGRNNISNFKRRR